MRLTMITLGSLIPGSFWRRGGQRWAVTAKIVDDTVLCCCLDDGLTAHFRLCKVVDAEIPF